MSDRDARFRRLAPTGDLFAHFGVALEPPVPEPGAVAVRVATACNHCGWFVDVGAVRCPICAQACAAGSPP